MSSKKIIYVSLFLLSFILYGNTIWNNYSLDDNYINTTQIKEGISGIPKIITSRYSIINSNGKEISLDYRPITLITFAIEHQFFGESPHLSHFINILLYALCLIVIYNFLISVLKLNEIQSWLPLIITLFYAIHPVHTEVVASLKNRDELFSLLFGILFLKYGLLFFSSTDKKVKYAIITMLFLILTLFSKVVGIIYIPIFILLLKYYNLLKINKRNLLIFIGSSFMLLIILSTIFKGLKRETYTFENSLVGVSDIMVVFPTCFKIILYHIKMLILPYPLRFYYGYNLFPIKSPFEISVLLSVLIYLGLLYYGIKLFRKKEVLGLIILCYLVSPFLYFNFPIPYTGMFSERALFLSSLWFITTVILILYKLSAYINNSFFNKLTISVGFFIFIIYSLLTIQRNFYWKDTLTLLTHDIPNLENSVNANYLYANALNNESKITSDSSYSYFLAEKAAGYYQHVIDLYPYYPDYFYQLALINRYKLNNIPKAKKLFLGMLKVDSTLMVANFELGKIYFEQNDFKTSYPYFATAYTENPKDSVNLFYFGQNALKVGDLNNCYKINKEFMDLYPNIKYPYLNLGVYYSAILKDDTAVIYFEKAIELGERNKELLNQLAIYYTRKNNKEKAKYYLNLE